MTRYLSLVPLPLAALLVNAVCLLMQIAIYCCILATSRAQRRINDVTRLRIEALEERERRRPGNTDAV